MPELFNYAKPGHASRTLAKLREELPHLKLEAVPSPTQAYAFRYVIRATTLAGKEMYVRKCKWEDIGEDISHVPYEQAYRRLNPHVWTPQRDLLREARRLLTSREVRCGAAYREHRKEMYRCMLFHHRKAQELVMHFGL